MKTTLTDTFNEPNRRLLQRSGDLMHLLYLEFLQRFEKIRCYIQIVVQTINTNCLLLFPCMKMRKCMKLPCEKNKQFPFNVSVQVFMNEIALQEKQTISLQC